VQGFFKGLLTLHIYNLRKIQKKRTRSKLRGFFGGFGKVEEIVKAQKNATRAKYEGLNLLELLK